MPIEMGDGQGIANVYRGDGSQFTRVKDGDGNLYFGQPAGPTILDNFESGTLDSDYTGDTSVFSVTSNNPYEGNYSLEWSTSGTAGYTLWHSTKTIAPTETPFGAFIKPDINNAKINSSSDDTLLFGQTNPGTKEGYGMAVDLFNNRFKIFRYDSGSAPTTIAATSPSPSISEQYWEAVCTQWTSSGDIQAELRDIDGSTVASISANDNTYGAGAFGVDTVGSTNSGPAVYWDYIYKG